MTSVAADGHVHAYPVDASLTADEAWAEICNFGRRVTFTGSERWATVRCDGEECRNIVGSTAEQVDR